MQLSTLGGLKLDGADFVRVKPLLLLTYVAVEGSKDRHHLAELFWRDAANPLNSLAAALTQLRQYAPGAIEIDLTRVSSAVECDATTFLQVADASHHEQALRLYQGPFLSGVYLPGWSAELEEWVYGTREFLAGRARSALLRSGEDIAVNGRFEEATKYAETAYLLPGAPELELEELQRVYTLLVAGHSSQLGRLRKDARGFGIELSLPTAEAREKLRCPLGSSSSPTTTQTLPTMGTSFIGRDTELVEVTTHLTRPDCSLLTLTGPGGVGKSRLAVRVAKNLSEHFSDGVYFISLEALSEVNLISASIAAVLGVTLQGNEDPLIQVTRHIGEKVMLLVLDNYEHLLEGATIAAQLLQACPNLKLLVTSRERLNLEEEWVLPLEGLPVPPKNLPTAEVSHHDAIKLFVERAKRTRLSFELTPDELPHVVRICQQVLGLPLGIELAAAWVKVLSCQEIAQEIERTIDLLSSNSRNVPERHRSFQTVFEHSWRLLTPKEQKVLRRLSVFRGGFRREAAAEVAGATIPVLASLVDKSLVRVTAGGRYDRHPLIYQCTEEKLSQYPKEETTTYERYTHYFLGYVEEAERYFIGPMHRVWLERLEEELDNLREVLAWVETHGDGEAGLRLAGALRSFWISQGHIREGRAWLTRLLAVARQETKEISVPVWTTALNAAAWLAQSQDDFTQAASLYEESAELNRTQGYTHTSAAKLVVEAMEARTIGNYRVATALLEKSLEQQRAENNRQSIFDDGIGLSLVRLGLVLCEQGDYVRAAALYQESLELHRNLSDSYGVAITLLGLSDIPREQANAVWLRTLCDECLPLFRELNEPWGIGYSLNNLALGAFIEGNLTQASAFAGESAELFSNMWSNASSAEILSTVGLINLARGNLDSAREVFTESLALAWSNAPRWLVAVGIEGLAGLAVRERRPQQAVRLFGAAAALRAKIGVPLSPLRRSVCGPLMTELSTMLSSQAWAHAWNVGQASQLELSPESSSFLFKFEEAP